MKSSDGKLFSSMFNMLQGGSTAKLHVPKYCLFLGKQMVDAKGDMELLHILTKGSQLDSISNEYFRFLGFFILLPS